MQTILGEIATGRALSYGVTPERFVEGRFTKEISKNGFADNLYKRR